MMKGARLDASVLNRRRNLIRFQCYIFSRRAAGMTEKHFHNHNGSLIASSDTAKQRKFVGMNGTKLVAFALSLFLDSR